MFKKMGVLMGWIAVTIVALALNSPAANAQGMIQVKGSDSEVNLVQRLAEVFMQKNPGVNISADRYRQFFPGVERQGRRGSQEGRGESFPCGLCHGRRIGHPPPGKPGIQVDD